MLKIVYYDPLFYGRQPISEQKTNCSIDIPSIGFVPAMEILSEKIIRY